MYKPAGKGDCHIMAANCQMNDCELIKSPKFFNLQKIWKPAFCFFLIIFFLSFFLHFIPSARFWLTILSSFDDNFLNIDIFTHIFKYF